MEVSNPNGFPQYSIRQNNAMVVQASHLGVVRSDGDLSKNMILTAASPVKVVKDSYRLFTGKRTVCNYSANHRVFHFKNKAGLMMDVVFQVSDDGVVFKYVFPGNSNDEKRILSEATTFRFDTAAKAWLQPMQVAKSGWESTNPAYEEHYKQNIAAGTAAPTQAGWIFPALFNTITAWVLLTESSLPANYCAGRLHASSPNAEYQLAFPDTREVMPGGELLPHSTLPFSSPWRVITIGSLKTIAESTLGTDVATAAAKKDISFVKPGKASWSWIMSKDDSLVYSEQKRYIDFAAEMKWEYCLIDADWDRKIGYEKIEELSAYASAKNVGLLLWYNSSGSWNTTKYSPKSKLITHNDRMAEFTRLKKMGIKGVKVDFFAGDGQSVIQYYIDILKDAADYGLMVNFHGATLPRGWQRTYPNLVTAEAIRGFEMVTFNQADADAEATHCAMQPFTRNAFDPMDFTAINLVKIPTRVKRKTSSAFELALSVIFLSGIQHIAESPGGMKQVPDFVRQYLTELPARWDEVKFLDGYPGELVLLARRSGAKWYIAGINATANEKTVSIDLSIFKKKKGNLITQGDSQLSFMQQEVAKSQTITMKASGGFVIVAE